MVPPHVPENEPLPHLPIYHPLIPEVRANCLELVNRFRTKISELGYQDKETEYLDKMFSDLENPRHETNTVQIALVGDAGHGKSSTINSLLGVDIAEYVSALFNTQRYQRC
jgi:predicted GTPase